MTEPALDYNDWLNNCFDYLVQMNRDANERFGIGNYERWDMSQDTGELVFSNGGKAEIMADVIIVGSFSHVSSTWLWGWANETILPYLTEDILRVKQYGLEHGITDLVEAKWSCEEQDAWAMAAVSLKLLGGQAVYRGPSQHGLTFLLLRNLRRMQ